MQEPKEIEAVTHTECGGVNAIVENTRIWQQETSQAEIQGLADALNLTEMFMYTQHMDNQRQNYIGSGQVLKIAVIEKIAKDMQIMEQEE